MGYRSRFFLSVFVSVLAALASGCSAPPPSPVPTVVVPTTIPPTALPDPTAAPNVTRAPNAITFMVFGEPSEMAAYQILVAAFEENNPGIPVELVQIPNQFAYRQRVDQDMTLGEPADVVVVNYRRFAKYANKRQLEPLGPRLEKSTVIHAEDIYPITLQAFQWKGQLQCIPQNFSGLVVYYNRDLFDASHVPYPDADWNWTDFLAAATQLTKDLNGDGVNDQHGLGTEANLVRVAPFIWQNGGQIVDSATNPARLTIDSPEATETMQFLSDLLVKNKVVPDSTEEIMESFESRFIHGKIAMFINSRRGVGLYREQAKFNWDVAPLPHGKTGANLLQVDGYCLPAASVHKESAWKLIEFASSAQGQSILSQAGRMVPPMKSVAESDAFLDPGAEPPASRVFLDSLDNMRLFPILPYWWEIEEIAGENLERAFHGDVSVKEAITRAIDRTLPYFTKP